jgi:putative transposase
MPRTSRIVIPDLPHHVTHHGNNCEITFQTKEDRLIYLNILKWYTQKHSVDLLGYCLMTNHVHLILTPHDLDSLGLVIHDAHITYTQHANKSFGRSGHLWQGRYYSCAMDDAHCVAALRYVEQNPVRAGLATMPWQYPWSSAKVHIEGMDPEGLLNLKWWSKNFTSAEWKDLLASPEDEKMVAEIRSRTRSGKPAGSSDFLKKYEEILGIDLQLKPKGRPKKGTGTFI